MADADVEKGAVDPNEAEEKRSDAENLGRLRQISIDVIDAEKEGEQGETNASRGDEVQIQDETSKASSKPVEQTQDSTDERIITELFKRFRQPVFWGVRSDAIQHVKVSGKGMKPTEQMMGAMHLRNVHYLRQKVLKHRLIIHAGIDHSLSPEANKLCSAMSTPERLDMVRDDLAHYSTALQNYKLWKEDCLDPTLEPATGFDGHGGTLAILECTESKKQLGEDWQRVMRGYIDPKMLDAAPQLPRRLTTQSHSTHIEKSGKSEKLTQFFSRLAMALFGGLALIAPMLIMSLRQTRLTALLTTSIFVIAVGVILAWWMDDAQDKDIVAATAAYAAVLVVFVGVTLTPTA